MSEQKFKWQDFILAVMSASSCRHNWRTSRVFGKTSMCGSQHLLTIAVIISVIASLFPFQCCTRWILQVENSTLYRERKLQSEGELHRFRRLSLEVGCWKSKHHRLETVIRDWCSRVNDECVNWMWEYFSQCDQLTLFPYVSLRQGSDMYLGYQVKK